MTKWDFDMMMSDLSDDCSIFVMLDGDKEWRYHMKREWWDYLNGINAGGIQ